jgi:3'-5' exoribonuclease
MEAELFTIADLKRAAQTGRVEARVHAQLESIEQKETSAQKPFFKLVFADAESKFTLNAWSDSPMFAQCEGLSRGGFFEVAGEFAHNGNFGLEAKRWTLRPLDERERDALLGGSDSLRERQHADFDFIVKSVEAIADPRLRALGNAFLADYGTRFRRTAAARDYHHARRGGLVEHTAQMMRSAIAIQSAYPQLNRDLLLAGILFHDCGKLWENALPESGFTMGYDERGELLGHIAIGVEVVNGLWRKLLASEEFESWKALDPVSEDVRFHLLHLILSHHGEKQFGSPVDPKTPEAQALHYIDNLDAKMEMFSAGYAKAAPLAPRIFERVRPLPGNLVLPLQKFEPPAESGTPESE